MDKYYKAISFYRRRNYTECLNICNSLLQQNILSKNLDKRTEQGLWILKLRSMTRRVFIDDLEVDDNDSEKEEIEFERIAATARPGTTIKSAFTTRPFTTRPFTSINRLKTSNIRPASGMIRLGTSARNRGTTAINERPITSGVTIRNIRLASAKMNLLKDPLSSTNIQRFRHNPTLYADNNSLAKCIFLFLFYHENDSIQAFSLCESVANIQKTKLDWWWNQQFGRCLISSNHLQKAEEYLLKSLSIFLHTDTYLLLSKIYIKQNQLEKAIQLLNTGIEKMPYEINLQIEMARIYEDIFDIKKSLEFYRNIIKLEPNNSEALSCIAVNHFYDNQPEIALTYYRRILSMGAHSVELYCNIALCCLYSGQLDLVLPCFQRCIRLIVSGNLEERANIWYNISFVALKIGDFHLAERCLKLSLSANGNNVEALNNLAILAIQDGLYIKAKNYLKAAENISPECIEVQENLKLLQQF